MDNNKIYEIKLTQQDLNNLKIFMERVSLTGKEVMAYNLVIKAIYEAKEIKGDKPKKVGE